MNIVTSQPDADAQIRPLIESLSETASVSAAAGSFARSFDAPSASIPPKVTATIVANGSSAFTARSFVPGFGSSGPASTPPSASIEAVAAAAGLGFGHAAGAEVAP